MSEHGDEARGDRSQETDTDEVLRALDAGGTDDEVRARWFAAGFAKEDPRTEELEELLAMRAALTEHGQDVRSLIDEAARPEAHEPGDAALLAEFFSPPLEFPEDEAPERMAPTRGWHPGWLVLSLASAAAAVLLLVLARGRAADGDGQDFGPMLGADGLAAWSALDADAQLLAPIGSGVPFGAFRWQRPAPVGGYYVLRVRDVEGRVLVEEPRLEGREWTPGAALHVGFPETIEWELVLQHPGLAQPVMWSGRATRE